MLLHIAAMMRHGAFGTVLMDRIAVPSLSTVLGVYAAVAEGRDTLMRFEAFIIETKVWAGAEVAVEFFHIMTLSMLFVERTEVGLTLTHILKIEIVDDRFLIKSLRQKFVDNLSVF